MVVSAAGIVDDVDVNVAVAGPVEEVLLVETAPAAAVSLLSPLTCAKSTVVCAHLKGPLIAKPILPCHS